MTLDPREQRAIMIAAMCRITHRDGVWWVPSQSLPEKQYVVNLAAEKCDCPDCDNGFVCKHIRAARIVLKRELNMDGSVTETKSITFEERKTYTQPWAQYNLSQIIEKKRLQVLLFDLCRILPDAEHKKRGPKPHRVRDCVFAMAFKVYCGLSSRRFSTDLSEAHKKGFLSRSIPGPKVTAFFENPAFTPILRKLKGSGGPDILTPFSSLFFLRSMITTHR